MKKISSVKTKFITFLGTNPYLECSYYFTDPSAEFYLTRFVQVSLIRHLVVAEKLGEDSEILILVTDEAKQRNWQDSIDRDGNLFEGLETQLLQLKKYLEQRNKKLPPFRLVDIPEGKSEEELWTIFNMISGEIQDDDHLFFDITHSFRSLPMLALVVLNYLRVVKNATIEKIYYGAFETLGSIPQVKTLKLEERNVPIFDLTPFVDLLQWTTASDYFIRTGNALLMTELTRRKTQPLLAKSKGKNAGAAVLLSLSKSLSNFTLDLFTLKGPRLSNDIFQIKANLEATKEHVQEIPPFANLFKKILLEFKATKKPQYIIENTNLLIEYCFKRGLIQQGYTLLDENLITYGCLCFGLDYKKPKHRQLFTSALSIQEQNIPEEKWHLDEVQKSLIYKILTHDLSQFIKVRKLIAPKRNALNHASFNEAGISYEDYINKGFELIKMFKNFIETNKVKYP